MRSQHDAHEFFCHVQAHADAPVFDGVWEARRYHIPTNSHDTMDSGTLQAGITIPIPPQTSSLNTCLRDWAMQSHTRALILLPQWVCVHLPRYLRTRTGTRKNRVCIQITAGEIVRIPTFSRRGSALQWIPYRIMAGIIHLGASALSGHYRFSLSFRRYLAFLGHGRQTIRRAL